MSIIDNPYGSLQAMGAGAGFAVHNASMLHEALSKPSFIKLNNKDVSFSNPYLDLSEYRAATNELQSYKDSKKNVIGRNMLQGAGAGATAGAGIGTAVGGPLGTVIGAIGGATFGAQAGLVTGLIARKKANDRISNRRATLDKNLQTRLANFNTANQDFLQTQASNERLDAINEQNYLNAMSVYG